MLVYAVLQRESAIYFFFFLLVTQLCPTLCDPMDYSPSGSSVLGILQERILEWVTISFSRGSSQPRDQTQVSHIVGRFLTIWDKYAYILFHLDSLPFL